MLCCISNRVLTSLIPFILQKTQWNVTLNLFRMQRSLSFKSKQLPWSQIPQLEHSILAFALSSSHRELQRKQISGLRSIGVFELLLGNSTVDDVSLGFCLLILLEGSRDVDLDFPSALLFPFLLKAFVIDLVWCRVSLPDAADFFTTMSTLFLLPIINSYVLTIQLALSLLIYSKYFFPFLSKTFQTNSSILPYLVSFLSFQLLPNYCYLFYFTFFLFNPPFQIVSFYTPFP